MSDHPEAITSRPELFPCDKGLLSWRFLIDETRFELACNGEIGGYKITRVNDCLWGPTYRKLEACTFYDQQYVLETLASAGFMPHGQMRGT